ncbi:unnamed protein product [Rotaria magnacalcarata]|uniref:HTH CENPB-type domain-containing protein n=5 Tax=Rotaria magnacalcarata TaxID=392030 RepID=A0A8S2J6Z1_9BILA|nr:unnamed protein product [Rotaria magnacalcarata]
MVPTALTMTIRNDKFLQFDSGPGDHRLIIFSSPEQLKILEETEEILIDGTFKVTPVIFTQLYTIHGVYRNCVFPLVFALLSDKQQQTYQRLINELRRLCPSWNPKSVMVDFEKGAINAFQGTFTTLSISGCFFHLQKSIQRKLQDLGLKTNYENDSKFAYDVNKIAALAFLLPSDVNQGFDDLYGSLPSILEPVLDYFEDTYIGRRRPNGRATPRYPVNLWNMHQRTINNSMRTNNQAEAWHRRLNSVIQCEHPSLWIFIQSLQKEENYIRCQLVKVNAGQSTLQTKKYLDYSKRLKNLLISPHPTLLRQIEGINFMSSNITDKKIQFDEDYKLSSEQILIENEMIFKSLDEMNRKLVDFDVRLINLEEEQKHKSSTSSQKDSSDHHSKGTGNSSTLLKRTIPKEEQHSTCFLCPWQKKVCSLYFDDLYDFDKKEINTNIGADSDRLTCKCRHLIRIHQHHPNSPKKPLPSFANPPWGQFLYEELIPPTIQDWIWSMPFRDHWRDFKTLHNDEIPIDTTSNETAKLFDATLTRYVGYFYNYLTTPDGLVISIGSVSNIIKRKAEYIENYEHNENSAKNRNFRDELSQQLDQKFYEWFAIQRSKNISIPGPLIQAKVREIRQQLGGANPDEFKVSNGWLEKFRTRHNIQYRTICGDSAAVDIHM